MTILFYDDYNKLYNAELRLGKIMDLFSGIAILLACLGLFGLSSYAAQQRIKEIGIRKVLGASPAILFTLLSKEFLLLVLLAMVIASPIAWIAMNDWLQDYAYKIDLSWWMFVIAGVVAICIALLTVSFQAFKVAVSNPVKSLRTE